jgi:hypothetical protein
MTVAEKSNINWSGVELAYRANIKSLKAIGSEFGLSDAGVFKRAKRDGWTRDLGAKIRAKAEAKVRAATVNAEVSAKTRVSENQVIEACAEMQKDAVLSHRADIQRSRRLAMLLLEELELATTNNDMLRRLSELMLAPDKNGMDKLHDQYLRIIAMPGRVDSLKKLSETLRTLIVLEREAFGIDAKDDRGMGSAIESVIKRVTDARRDAAWSS